MCHTLATQTRSCKDSSAVWGPWLLGWLGAAALGVTNGAVRQVVYQRWVGARAAHYVSTAGLLLLLGAYIRLLARRWPIRHPRQALLVGGAWSALTVLFEFGFGRGVARESWTTLLQQYDVRRGYVCMVIPVWMAVAPRFLAVRTCRSPIEPSLPNDDADHVAISRTDDEPRVTDRSQRATRVRGRYPARHRSAPGAATGGVGDTANSVNRGIRGLTSRER
jgi:hypothetical protein